MPIWNAKQLRATFSFLLHPPVGVTENHLRSVVVVPIKGYAAGLWISKMLDAEYIAYQVRFQNPR